MIEKYKYCSTVPRTFFQDCRIYEIIVLHENDKLTRIDNEQQQPTIKPTIHGRGLFYPDFK